MPELIKIGVSALVANKANLATTGHNISNAQTPGYSRQQAINVANPPQRTGAGYIGTGVSVDGVRRMVNEFVDQEVRTTADNANRLEEFETNAAFLDSVLGEESAGLSPVVQRFFTAVQTVSEDPSSIANRQGLISSAGVLTDRVNQTHARLDSHNSSINDELATYTADVTSLARSIAQLNNKITASSGSKPGYQPNDLLDQRDATLGQLAELVSTQTVKANDGSINVYIGEGQALVVGDRAFGLTTAPGEADSARVDIVFESGASKMRVTESIQGGKIGGLLDFREQVLDRAYGQIGLIAIGTAHSMNEQHQLGMTLDGQIGGNFFNNINDPAVAGTRAIPSLNNRDPQGTQARVDIIDPSLMSEFDYELKFAVGESNSFTVERADGVVVAEGINLESKPQTIAFDGVEVVLESGQYVQGDSLKIIPARLGGRDMGLALTNARDLALAQPIRVESNAANRGTGVVGQGQVLDTSTDLFAQSVEQTLAPPLVVRFTAANRYEVLDNSDPANPKALDPPMQDLPFVPGVANTLFPDDRGEQIISSAGAGAGLALRNASAGVYDNGYAEQTVVVTGLNATTEVVSREELTFGAGQSAQATAAQLNGLEHASTKARNQATISEIGSSTPMQLVINGQTLTVTTPNQLAVAINASPSLAQQGIRAQSDGSQVELTADSGLDFNLQLLGGVSDQLQVQGINGPAVVLNGADTIPEVTIGGVVDMVLAENASAIGRGGNFFEARPSTRPNFLGIQVTLSGAPAAGDLFEVNYNQDGVSDNRNARKLADIQSTAILNQGSSTISDSYGDLISFIGTQAKEANLAHEAAETLYSSAVSRRESISGVNLDEEAANVIKFEQAYNASAQLIAVARSIFDTLLQSVS